MPAPTTLKDFCTLLVRSKLMTPDEVKGVVRQFQAVVKDPDDLDSFRKLLFANRFLTEYQLALVSRGHGDGFFLDQYKILELIAKGNMAGVYKAVHQSGQTVAIKVLPASKAKDPEALGRFRREARLITKLDHPNIVRAFQLGEANNRHYLAMELLEGDTLEEILAERKRLPPMEAVRIAHQVMLGLQHLYEKGMIHRDINPGNIMLLEADTGHKTADTLDRPVKILDIGLGKSVFDEKANSSGDPSQLTNDGVLLGSPEYLSPEQARKASAADIRSDIYSAGCVLFHMLAGEPPFPDKSILNQVMRHATEPPRPLSEFLSPVPDGLQSVLNGMLAKDPAQRYPTPDKAAQALQMLIRNIPANAKAPGHLPEYLKWLQESSSLETALPPTLTLPPVTATPPAPAPKSPAPAGIAIGRLEPSGKKTEPVRKTAPAAVPAGMVPTPMPVSADEFDVELVDTAPAPMPMFPAPVPVRPQDPDEPRSLFELDRRDAIMLGVGSGMALLAILGGYGLSRALRRTPPSEANPEPEPNPPANSE